MKKILFTIVMAAMCLGAAAQLRTSRTVFTQPKVEKPKQPIRMDWYVCAGLSLNNINSENFYYDHKDNKFAPGFSAGVGFNRFFQSSQAYWGAELGLGSNGMKFVGERGDWYSNGIYHTRTDKNTLFAVTAQLTPKIGYQLPMGETTAIDFHVGGFVSYELGRSVSCQEGYELNWEDGDGLQAGPQGGIGVWFGRFNVDISFQYGFGGSLGRLGYADLEQSYNLLLRLGYAF